jgi:hypothetical protein
MRAALASMVVVWAACDPRATASGTAGRADQKSHEYESCSASAQCQDELRCFDHACRRTARSTVGDYYAAAGAYARSRGDIEAATAAYAQALAHYDADKVPLPPDVDCAYGAALAAARTKRDHAELGARVLHRCLLAAPAGSRLRDQALADLATLGDAGLDPVLLGASKLADLYLTKRPARPATESLAISVTASPMPAGKSFPQIPDKLGAPELRGALVACWEAYSAAAHRDALTVTLGLKSILTPSDYDDEPATFATRLEPPALPPGSPEAAAEACVRAVAEPAIKAVKLADAFTTRLAISIK